MTAESQYDVIVVGAGIAGLVAANRAAQLGLKVLVLEQGSAEKYLCNTRYTGGTLHICLREITLDAETLEQEILRSTAGFVSPPLARMLAQEGRRVVRWLQDEGLRFMRASASEYHKWVLAPPGRTRPGLDWEGRSGDVLLRTLGANLARRKGELLRGVRAHSLMMDGDRCTGVAAARDGATVCFSGRAVIIADGGFQGDAELVGRYISKAPASLKQRGAGTGRGDGLKMAQAVGAALSGMDRFYGHTLSRDAFTNDQLWPYPYLDSLVTAGIVVDGTGRRFVDEGGGGVLVANAIAQREDPLCAVCVFDRAIWEGPGRNGLIPANPHLPRVGGTLHEAPSIEALGGSMTLPSEAVAQTVAEYNNAFAAGSLGSLQPVARRTSRYRAWPVIAPPFYAVPLCAGITYTMGGITVNEHAQALKADGTPIPGLYAAGAAAGSLEGGPAIGYVGGLAKGGVTGLVSAEHIASNIKSDSLT